jgi:hypothetical protein
MNLLCVPSLRVAGQYCSQRQKPPAYTGELKNRQYQRADRTGPPGCGGAGCPVPNATPVTAWSRQKCRSASQRMTASGIDGQSVVPDPLTAFAFIQANGTPGAGVENRADAARGRTAALTLRYNQLRSWFRLHVHGSKILPGPSRFYPANYGGSGQNSLTEVYASNEPNTCETSHRFGWSFQPIPISRIASSESCAGSRTPRWPSSIIFFATSCVRGSSRSTRPSFFNVAS